jgi:hypothetical protein
MTEVFVVMKKGKLVQVDSVHQKEASADKRACDIIKELYGVEPQFPNSGKYVPYEREYDVWVEVVKSQYHKT